MPLSLRVSLFRPRAGEGGGSESVDSIAESVTRLRNRNHRKRRGAKGYEAVNQSSTIQRRYRRRGRTLAIINIFGGVIFFP